MSDGSPAKKRRLIPSDRVLALLFYGCAWLCGGIALASDQVIWVVPMILTVFAFVLYVPRLDKGAFP
jgi:hypothetical protein